MSKLVGVVLASILVVSASFLSLGAPPKLRRAQLNNYTLMADRALWGREVEPMADAATIWQAASSGDFNLASNWSNGVPGAAADKLGICDGTSQVSLAQNLDQSGASFTFKFRTTPDYFGSVGGPGNPLIVKTTSANPVQIQLRGRGRHHVAASQASPMYIDIGGGFASIVRNNAFLGTTVIKSGEVVIAGDLFLQNPLLIIDGVITLEKEIGTSPGPATFLIRGGTVLCERDIDRDDYTVAVPMSLQVLGGTLRLTGVIDDVPVTVNGGTLQYVPAGTVAAGGFDLYALAGLFDASESSQVIQIANLVKSSGANILGSINSSLVGGTAEFDLSQDWQ